MPEVTRSVWQENRTADEMAVKPRIPRHLVVNWAAVY
jgi:hypothetical protein